RAAGVMTRQQPGSRGRVCVPHRPRAPASRARNTMSDQPGGPDRPAESAALPDGTPPPPPKIQRLPAPLLRQRAIELWQTAQDLRSALEGVRGWFRALRAGANLDPADAWPYWETAYRSIRRLHVSGVAVPLFDSRPVEQILDMLPSLPPAELP